MAKMRQRFEVAKDACGRFKWTRPRLPSVIRPRLEAHRSPCMRQCTNNSSKSANLPCSACAAEYIHSLPQVRTGYEEIGGHRSWQLALIDDAMKLLDGVAREGSRFVWFDVRESPSVFCAVGRRQVSVSHNRSDPPDASIGATFMLGPMS